MNRVGESQARFQRGVISNSKDLAKIQQKSRTTASCHLHPNALLVVVMVGRTVHDIVIRDAFNT